LLPEQAHYALVLMLWLDCQHEYDDDEELMPAQAQVSTPNVLYCRHQ
jgi:hypothetical protein